MHFCTFGIFSMSKKSRPNYTLKLASAKKFFCVLAARGVALFACQFLAPLIFACHD